MFQMSSKENILIGDFAVLSLDPKSKSSRSELTFPRIRGGFGPTPVVVHLRVRPVLASMYILNVDWERRIWNPRILCWIRHEAVNNNGAKNGNDNSKPNGT